MSEQSEQQSLLPAKQPTGKFRRIKLEAFKHQNLIGPTPTKAMVQSVRAVGVFQPIAVVQVAKGKYKVGAGIRRILASIEADQKTIPAMVYEDEGQMREAITLMENAQRSANPIGELQAIDHLIKQNFSVEQIAHDTGMPLARVRKRIELQKLHKDLYAALLKRKISVNVGQAVCKLPMVYQLNLLVTLAFKGLLTMQDVREQKAIRRQVALSQLSTAIISPEIDRTDWKAKYEAHLAHVQQFLNDMFHMMIDPVGDFGGTVQELTALLLKTATEQREKDYQCQCLSKSELPSLSSELLSSAVFCAMEQPYTAEESIQTTSSHSESEKVDESH